jgi:Ca-activated chloride channel homolog
VALLLGERRRARAVAPLAAALVLLAGPNAGAKHAGIEKFERRDYAGALGEFDREVQRRDLAELHFNAGTAAFELGDYAAAASSFSKALGLAGPELKNRAAYNLANTIARRGAKQEKKEDKLPDLKDAVRQYDEVLKTEPAHADAKHNRELVAKFIEELEKEEKQKDEQQQDKKDDQEKKDQQQKQDSSQGGKDDQQKQDKQPQSSKQDGDGKDGKGKDDQAKQEQPGKEEGKDEKQKEQPQSTGGKDGEKKEGERPKPEPGETEKEKSGELKAASPGQEAKDKEGEAAEAAEAAAAAAEGRMTEKDAKQLLEALRKFDQRVRLLDPREQQQPTPNRPFKNW